MLAMSKQLKKGDIKAVYDQKLPKQPVFQVLKLGMFKDERFEDAKEVLSALILSDSIHASSFILCADAGEFLLTGGLELYDLVRLIDYVPQGYCPDKLSTIIRRAIIVGKNSKKIGDPKYL